MKILVFFTFNVSLKLWCDKGLLQREIRLYQDLIRKFGVEVVFVTYGNKSDYEYQNLIGEIDIIPIYDLIKKPNNKLIQILQTLIIPFKIKQAVQASDIIKTNQVLGAWVASIASILYKKPLLVRGGYELYDFALKANKSRGYRWFVYMVSWIAYKSANRVHVATKGDRDFIVDRFGVDSSKAYIFPNWIDTKKYKPLKNVNKKNKSSVLFVGRLNRQKNIELLLRALSGTGISLDLVGEGSLKDSLKAKASQLGVLVNFFGSISNDQMPQIYNDHQVYVLCSHYEGNPKTLLEAMSCGCAVIGTNVPGIKEIIVDKENGLIVRKDECELRESIIRLTKDPDLRHQLGSVAVESVASNNSLSALCNREIDTYKDILAR